MTYRQQLYLSLEISIEQLSVGLAQLAQIYIIYILEKWFPLQGE